jgi:subtilase family serine protease
MNSNRLFTDLLVQLHRNLLKGEEMNKPKEQQRIYSGTHGVRRGRLLLWPIAFVALAGLAFLGPSATAQVMVQNTPSFVAGGAKNLGPEDPAKTMEISIWLQPHNRAELDALAESLYDKTSPAYGKFLTHREFAARFAPSAAEAKTVQQFFTSHSLKVVSVGPGNFYVRASGTVAQVQDAFRVQLNNYQVKDKVIRANDRDPVVEGPAGSVARFVSGLDTGRFQHPLDTRPNNLNVRSPDSLTAVSSVSTENTVTNPPGFFTNDCLPGLEKESISNGSFPIGTYSGNKLGSNTATGPGCGYTPSEIQTAYGLTSVYAKGFDGAGQTIGIIDWCGTPTILQDANGFSKQFELPALVLGQNFNIIYTPTPSYCITTGDVEINLDVEWAHAIAPGANINLIVPPSATFQDIDEAEYIAIVSGLANVISGSYGSQEIETSSSEMENGNLINEIAAIFGVSANFSSGDAGDYSSAGSFPVTVSYPANTPYATAVGGTSLVLNANNSIREQMGWGTDFTSLASEGTILDPLSSYFVYGSGGGPSTCVAQGAVDPQTGYPTCLAGFPKPAYQAELPGNVRQIPDISWLADPFTGGVIYITIPGVYGAQFTTVGGTSLACPMFSALWAIANQEAGRELGQAAPYLYTMPESTIKDIAPKSSPNNVTASIRYQTSTKNYTAAQVAGVSVPFISAIWDYPYVKDTVVAVTFGTDSSLTVKTGWDNVTGLGVPNAGAFADYFLGK